MSTNDNNRSASISLAIKIAKDLQEDKLTLGNFEPWSATIEAILQDVNCGSGNATSNVWTVVMDVDNLNDPAPDPANATAAILGRYKQGAAFAKTLMERTMDSANKSQARSMPPRQAWLHLRGIHRSSAPAHLSKIEDKMNSLSISKMRTECKGDEQGAMLSYTSAMSDLRERYEAASGTMDEAALFYKIVRNLPSEYGAFKAQLETKDGMPFHELTSFLAKAAISIETSTTALKKEGQGRDDALLTLSGNNKHPQRQQHNNNKNKDRDLCNNFVRKGVCSFGDKCRFMHLTAGEVKRFHQYVTKNKEEANCIVMATSDDYAEDLL
jgi:hypothetical protein